MAKVSGEGIVKRIESKSVGTLRQWFDNDDFKRKLTSALPKIINRDAFIINAFNIYANNTKLQQCTIASFLNALMQAAKVGLIPNTPLGHCHIIPYSREATFQMGYPGYIDLALRTNQYKAIYAHAVYPGDEFSASYGLHKDLIHIPSEDPIPAGTKPTHYYACYKLINGGEDFIYWTRDRVLKHRDRFSSGYKTSLKYKNTDSNVWETDEEIMGRKTMIIQVLKMAPKSTEMISALSTEEETKGYLNVLPANDNIVEWNEAEPEETEPDEEPELTLTDLETIAISTGCGDWSDIILAGCKLKVGKKPLFSADVTEEQAKDILTNDKERFKILYEYFEEQIKGE